MRAVLLSFVALTLAFAPAPFSKQDRSGREVSADLERLQGTWEVVSEGSGLKARGRKLTAGTRLVIARRCLVFHPGPKLTIFTINLQKLPRQMSLQDEAGNVIQALYGFHEDSLIVFLSMNPKQHALAQAGWLELRRKQ